MAGRDKVTAYHPFAFNILRLQQYNFAAFSLEEIVFFEYMIIKAVSFKFRPFFHSARTISDETGIRKTKLKSIISRFGQEGFITTDVKGFPKVTFFTVNFETIYQKLSIIYRLSENRDLQSYFGKLRDDSRKQNKKKAEAGTTQADNLTNGDSFTTEDARRFLDELERGYNRRRKEWNQKYPDVVLGFKKEVTDYAHAALNELGKSMIRDAFVAYIDKLINNELKVKRILPYFFNKLGDSFDVINAMADVYNAKYMVEQ